ncbi:hypothetical protein SLEP1_g48129 [Rubroshorea leprosula]|uniref:Uncharacterized protein n=1 Tax=Rubroshorea leprosula TaxID=152421 RepID=A0AAV5LTK4_9ROSI|nr:hypothetical protein SLEP1_g48129 [Rubroshorea leprosula]
MAPSRRNISGRSPLVNQNRQITSFFSKTASASHSASPSPAISIQNPKPKLSMSPRSSPTPTTRSPIQSKLKKPLLVIGQRASTPTPKSYGEEVLERRIEVYRPLEKAWYKGVVKSFDKESGKHLVHYDDAEEESLDLEKERIEWVHEEVRVFKRLRRGVSSAFKRVVIEDDDELENVEDKSNHHSDEDWGKKNKNVEEVSDDTEEEDTDLRIQKRRK